MSPTAFEDIALEGSARVTDHALESIELHVRRRVKRTRAGHVAVAGGAAVLAGGAIAFGALQMDTHVSPASEPAEVLDPAAIPTVAGGGGTNLVGDCAGDDDIAVRPDYEAKNGTYSILIGIVDCATRSVSGKDLIEASTTLRDQTVDVGTTTWLRTTITNVSDQTLAFDLASPTLEIAVPEDSYWFHEIMTASRPLRDDETWSDRPNIEGWGGSGSPRGGIGQVVTPRLDGTPAPGVAWNLVLQRPQDQGMNLSTSRGSVALAPGKSFVFETGLSLQAIAADDDEGAQKVLDLLKNPDQLTASAYVALQADGLGGAPRTLLIDATVPLTRED